MGLALSLPTAGPTVLCSSIPSTSTLPTGGRGTRNNDWSSVASEILIPNLLAKRSPPLSQVAKPVSCTAARKRLVKREETSSQSGSLSTKILREQVALRQKNFFTVSNRRRGRPAQGRSRGFLR